MISISSTYLRDAINDTKDIRYLLHDKVLNYISNNHLYGNQVLLKWFMVRSSPIEAND